MNGQTLRKQYKEKISDYRNWEQLEHAEEYMLFPGNFDDDITCLDTDYQTAKTMAAVLIQHNAKVFSMLPSSPQPVALGKGQRNLLKQQFFDRLPSDFDRKAYSQLAEELGLNPKSIDRTIRKWCDEGRIENIAHGRYQKVDKINR